MKKVSSTKAKLKKGCLYKEACIQMDFLSHYSVLIFMSSRQISNNMMLISR